MSYSSPEAITNNEHNVFSGIPVRPNQEDIFAEFLAEQDLSSHTIEALVLDTRKFAKWFTAANHEPFDVKRVTTRDIADFRDFLQREKKQAASTINRNIASLRKYFKWLTVKNYITTCPTSQIKEIRKQPIAPQGLTRAEIRKLLREVELRNDIRNKAIFTLVLYTGARLSDVVNLELSDVMLLERSGSCTFRQGKGNKVRTVPLPLQARKALSAYLEIRPPVQTEQVFIGERGKMNNRGIQAIFEKYVSVR